LDFYEHSGRSAPARASHVDAAYTDARDMLAKKTTVISASAGRMIHYCRAGSR